MRPISGDEQNHYEYYRKAAEASLAVDPDGTLIAMNNVYGAFAMPGAEGIPGFDRLALEIGVSGVFDLETVARSKAAIVNKLGIVDTEPVTDDGKEAQAKIIEGVSEEAITGQRAFMESLRDQHPTRLDNGLKPFILGKTVEFVYQGAPEHQRITGLTAKAA